MTNIIKLKIISSNSFLLDKVFHCVPNQQTSHQQNLENIIHICDPYLNTELQDSSFNVFDYLASFIDEKDKYWDYKTNTIDELKLLYTWITVGYRNKLEIKKFKRNQSFFILHSLKYYNYIIWYIKIKRPHVKKKYDAILCGLSKFNIKKTSSPSDGCGVFAGVLDGNMKHIKNSSTYLYIDNAYTPNLYHKYYSLASNDLQSLIPYDVPDDRLKNIYGNFFSKWKFNPNGSYILICPPSLTMGEFYNIDINKWIFDYISNIRQITDSKIIVRIKPNEFKYKSFDSNKRISTLDTLIKSFKNIEVNNNDSSSNAIKNSSLVIGFNSRILVESLFLGKPILCSSSSICHTLSNISLYNSISCPLDYSNMFYKWVCSMCYCQWTLDELSSGLFIPYTLVI